MEQDIGGTLNASDGTALLLGQSVHKSVLFFVPCHTESAVAGVKKFDAMFRNYTLKIYQSGMGRRAQQDARSRRYLRRVHV